MNIGRFFYLRDGCFNSYESCLLLFSEGKNKTMTPADILSILLAAYLILSLAIAFAYLSRRRLTLGEWLFWGLVAVLVPVFGPFFVISARPGPRQSRRRQPHPQL